MTRSLDASDCRLESGDGNWTECGS